MSQYVYLRSDPGLYAVGFYRPDGKWEAESDHTSSEEAAKRASLLNGAAPSPENSYTSDLRGLRHADTCRGVFENEPCTCGLREARRLLKSFREIYGWGA